MYTVYFTIPTNGTHPTMQELLASDELNAGMLECVTEDGLYSWHDIPTKAGVLRVLEYIRENIGNYTCTVCEEIDVGGGDIREQEISIADFHPMNENDSVLIVIDRGTHIDEVYHPAKHIPDFFDQCEVLEIVNEETGELLYRDQEIPDDPMPYIAETLMDFLKEVEFV